MEPDKRNLFLAIALCVVILGVWQWTMAPQAPSPAAVAEKREHVPPPDAAGRSPGTTADVPAAPEPTGQPVAPQPEQTLILETPEARYEFSSLGGTLRAAHLKGAKFQTGPGGKDGASPLEIVRAGTDPTSRPLRLSLPRSDFELDARAGWTVLEAGPDRLVLSAQSPRLRVTRTVRVRPEAYRLGMEIAVESLVDEETKHNLVLHLYGRQDPAKKGGGFFDYATASVAEMVCHVNGSIERHGVEGLRDKPFDAQGSVRWVAADERFFTIAAVPAAQAQGELRKCGLRGVADEPGAGEVLVAFPERKLGSRQSTRYEFEVYVGPKYRDGLAGVEVPGAGDDATARDAELDGIVNVTFAFLSRPLLSLLKLFYRLTGNWGLAIILLTMMVRMLTFWPTHKQLVSGKKMARLAPKMAELKKKYGGDRERLGRETMNLYKSHGVNPLGGCLPALIQMPIWIALFSTLSYSVELYRSAFALHIQDLSAPDPFYLAPLIMGAVMFLQMRMAPPGADPAQQKMMAVMMPVMFTGFSLFLPAGLAIYTLTSYLIGILHQLWVNRLDRRDNGPLVAGTVS